MAEAGGSSIRLSLLIDSLLQKTYHDLNVLSELKIEIVKFASKTRQQFISLLAVVKWAASAKKVDECQEIAQQLEQKSLFFVDTADQLFRLSRDFLPNAKLPNFAIPAAVDVLTTGTYSRLPTCIKEKIIPPDPITPELTLETLDKLNHLIQQRLVATTVPQPLQKLQVADGRVKFHVDGEFEATLTVMTDDDSIPWRLLELKILVEDPDEGEQKTLVHQKQLQFLHQLVQSRLFTDSDELLDMYNCLHAFCVSLQLEVLHAQSRRLVVQRWGDDVKVKDYEYGQSFSLEYWSQLSSSQAKPSISTDSTCKLTIYVEDANPATGLRVKHSPTLSSHMESTDIQQSPTNMAVYHGRLSVEQLLNGVLKSRCADQLLYLKERLESTCPGLETTFLGLELCSLIIKWKPLHQEVHNLVVSVNHQTGHYQVKLAEDVLFSDQQMKVDLRGLEAALNSDDKDAGQASNQMLRQLRCQLTLLSEEEAVCQYPVQVVTTIPVVNIKGHALSQIGPNRLFFQLKQHRSHCILVEVSDASDGYFNSPVQAAYYLLYVTPCQLPLDKQSAILSGESQEECPDVSWDEAMFFKAGVMKRLCPSESNKRAEMVGDSEGVRSPLPQLVATVDEYLPYVRLCEELIQHGVAHSGIEKERDTFPVVRLLQIPVLQGAVASALENAMESCTVHYSADQSEAWIFEITMSYCPLQIHNKPDHSQHIVFTYDSSLKAEGLLPVQWFISQWRAVGKLYGPVLELAAYLDDKNVDTDKIASVVEYNYKRIVLSYGPKRQFKVSIWWDQVAKLFQLAFGTCSGTRRSNPHSQAAVHLQKAFNKTMCIPLLLKGLHHTLVPYSAVSELLSGSPQLAVRAKQSQMIPHRNFTVLFRSPSHFQLVYRKQYAIDVQCRTNQLVVIRDCAYSQFDATRVIGGLSTIQCFKSFLLRFSERCQFQQVTFMPSVITSGMESPLPITPRIVTPSATTMPFFPTLPAPSRGGSISATDSRHSSRQPSPHPNGRTEQNRSEKMEPKEKIAAGIVQEGQDDIRKFVGESPIPSGTRELTDVEQKPDLPPTPVMMIEGPPSSINPGTPFSPSLNQMTSPIPPGTAMEPSPGTLHGMSRDSHDLSDMVDLTGSPGFLHSLPSSSPGSMILGGPSGIFMPSAHSPHADIIMTMTANPTTPHDIMDPLGMDNIIMTGAETPELPTLAWDTTPPTSQSEFLQAIDMFPTGTPGQSMVGMSGKMDLDADEMGFGVSGLDVVTVDDTGFPMHTTMSMAQTIDTLTDLPSIPSLGGSVGMPTEEDPMDTAQGDAEPENKIDDQPTPDLTMLPSLPPPEPTPPAPTPAYPVSQQAAFFMSSGDETSPLDSPTNTPDQQDQPYQQEEDQLQIRRTDESGTSMLFPSPLKNYLTQQQMQTEGWAAACPAPVHQDVFYSLLKPEPIWDSTARALKKPFCETDQAFEDKILVSPLERFLGSVYLLHGLTQKLSELGVPVNIVSSDQTSIVFQVGSLDCTAEVNVTGTDYSLQLKPVPKEEPIREILDESTLFCLEKFFSYKVACPPYSVETLKGFLRLLGTPPTLLKDCTNIVDMELNPLPSYRWKVEVCLVVPPGFRGLPQGTVAGSCAVVYIKSRLLLLIRLVSMQGARQSIVLPLLYNPTSNETVVVPTNKTMGKTYEAAAQLVTAFQEHCKQQGLNGSPTLFRTLRALVMDLVLLTD